jgi:hypothetical protein
MDAQLGTMTVRDVSDTDKSTSLITSVTDSSMKQVNDVRASNETPEDPRSDNEGGIETVASRVAVDNSQETRAEAGYAENVHAINQGMRNVLADAEGFQSPRRSARSLVSRAATPETAISSSRYFPRWFDEPEVNGERPDGGEFRHSTPSPRWSEMEEEGIGEMPDSWVRRSIDDVGNVAMVHDDSSLENLLQHLANDLTPQTRELLNKRANKVRTSKMQTNSSTTYTTDVSSDESISEETNRNNRKAASGRPTPQAHHPGSSNTLNGGRATTPRIPAADKGKKIDPRERQGRKETRHVPVNGNGVCLDKNKERERLQIKADALLAWKLQHILDNEVVNKNGEKSNHHDSHPKNTKSTEELTSEIAAQIQGQYDAKLRDLCTIRFVICPRLIAVYLDSQTQGDCCH